MSFLKRFKKKKSSPTVSMPSSTPRSSMQSSRPLLGAYKITMTPEENIHMIRENFYPLRTMKNHSTLLIGLLLAVAAIKAAPVPDINPANYDSFPLDSMAHRGDTKGVAPPEVPSYNAPEGMMSKRSDPIDGVPHGLLGKRGAPLDGIVERPLNLASFLDPLSHGLQERDDPLDSAPHGLLGRREAPLDGAPHGLLGKRDDPLDGVPYHNYPK
ncbi:hypothetical protein BGZ80_004430 [Entomortierella chlamydospora]|uniref:Uncharacterized protein n=1 Tax=Entomortierella chlamydospora TaxID=101097 RepID=A0A9P6T2K2_9FUNG|nr:hypothetical protein BGZ79_007196 [Entomortierella chlamydospora]KAG0020305.1 hypothetical protein BGZ80_004430 [Entomortierella chlamydospora]